MVLRSASRVEPCYKDIVSYVLEADDYDAHKPVLVDALDTTRSFSIDAARKYVRKLVAGFKKYDLKKGQTVCVHMLNHILYPVFFLGIVGAEGCYTGSNPAYTATELAHHFNISETKIVLTELAHLDVVQRAIEMCRPSSIKTFVLDACTSETESSVLSMNDLLSQGSLPWKTFEDDTLSKTTPAYLGSTSGTTGLPKMAVKSHYSLVTENQAIEEFDIKQYTVRRLLTVPFFHGFAAPLALISALKKGHLTYVMRRFNQEQFFQAISDLEITETALPVPLIVRFLALPESERQMLRNIELAWSGGAVLPANVQNRAVKMLGSNARIAQVWGMTEGGWMTTFKSPEHDDTGSVGRLLATYEARIVDENNQEIFEQGVRGEISIRGPINMMYYLNDPGATKGIFDADGWLKSGDIAHYDNDGKLYIVDRKKELIKVRAWQVAPAELEDRLLAHDDINDAAVIGVAHKDESTEIPRAYVVLRTGASVSPGNIKSFLLQTLSKYKVQDCEIRFTDSIPKSASGKLLKRVLREEVARETECNAIGVEL